MDRMSVTALTAQPVMSSLMLLRFWQRPPKPVTAVTCHVATAPYVAAAEVASESHAASAACSSALSAGANTAGTVGATVGDEVGEQ